MKKVDFTGNFIGIDGEAVIDENGKKIEISSYISKRLSQVKTDDPIRTINLCKKIFKEKNVSLEDHDIKYIKDNIKLLPIMDVLSAELLNRLESAK
jgi:hypothetical protein